MNGCSKFGWTSGLKKKKHWKGTSIARFVYQREQLNNTKDAGEMIDGIGLW